MSAENTDVSDDIIGGNEVANSVVVTSSVDKDIYSTTAMRHSKSTYNDCLQKSKTETDFRKCFLYRGLKNSHNDVVDEIIKKRNPFCPRYGCKKKRNLNDINLHSAGGSANYHTECTKSSNTFEELIKCFKTMNSKTNASYKNEEKRNPFCGRYGCGRKRNVKSNNDGTINSKYEHESSLLCEGSECQGKTNYKRFCGRYGCHDKRGVKRVCGRYGCRGTYGIKRMCGRYGCRGTNGIKRICGRYGCREKRSAKRVCGRYGCRKRQNVKRIFCGRYGCGRVGRIRKPLNAARLLFPGNGKSGQRKLLFNKVRNSNLNNLSTKQLLLQRVLQENNPTFRKDVGKEYPAEVKDDIRKNIAKLCIASSDKCLFKKSKKKMKTWK